MQVVLESIRAFIETGGDILWVILFTALLLWTLILERFLFLRFTYPKQKRDWIDAWSVRQDKHSWQARRIKTLTISRAGLSMGLTLPIAKMLVALCPMLGLLGTVTGMIEVFDVMAVIGTGNARAMASGVSMATIPTMAGMVVAVSGLFFVSRLEHTVKKEKELLSDRLA